MKKIAFIGALLLALSVLFVPLSSPTRAHHAVLRFNLEEMVATSDRIFVGKCIDVQETEEMIAQGILPITNYTFTVSEVIKGNIPQKFTFKQLGHRPKKPIGKKAEIIAGGYVADPKSSIHGMSGFQVGDELMLMLIPQHMDGQLTYPVGLYQGAFYVNRSSSGKTTIKNSINNRGLFTNPYNNYSKRIDQARVIFPDADQPIQEAKMSRRTIDILVDKPGALPLEEFSQLVRTIVESE